jgi:3',5'-cyclic-AMP phosphodiesterase
LNRRSDDLPKGKVMAVPIQVLHLSDIHFSDSSERVQGCDPNARLDAVLDVCLEDAAFDLVVVTGDLTDDGRLSSCKRLSEALARVGSPVFAVPGNHDDPEAVEQVFPNPTIELGAWRVVGIDTSRPNQIHGTVDVAEVMSQLDRLDERPTVVAMHHPPLSPSTNPMFQLDDAAHLLAELGTRRRVRAVITGHLHLPFELLSSSGTTVLGCPSTLVGIAHHGQEFVVGGCNITGARLLTLDEHGDAMSRIVAA